MGLKNFVKFMFSSSKTENTYRQDRYKGEKSTGRHEHTWSKTTAGGGGRHKEGWIGKNAPRLGGRNK